MKSRQEIKALAKESIIEQCGVTILIIFILFLMTFVSIALDEITRRMFGNVMYWVVYWIGLLILVIMEINILGEFVKVYKREKASVKVLFSGFKINFFRKLGGILWLYLWIVLWMLLFFIPGFVKLCAYYFTKNILAVYPKVTARQALKISMRITQGYRKEIFIFMLSWIGWMLLSVLTLGILWVVYVGPYWFAADAGLFLEMRDKALADGRITHEELGIEKDKDQECDFPM